METIDSLKKKIADWVFLRSLLSEFDIEKKLEINSNISTAQKMLDSLLAEKEQKRLGDINILKELIEQSVKPIQERYKNIHILLL